MHAALRYADFREVTLGLRPADLVLKGGRVLNVFTGELLRADVAICGDTIVGVGRYEGLREVDCTDGVLCPGFIDAHMHIESTLTRPYALGPALLARGTTAVIADAHELVNVLGAKAIDFLLAETEEVGVDVFMMLPSSVPATRFETNGADFTADDMRRFVGHPRVLGLAEVMCYPDVLAGDPEVLAKLDLFADAICDGHAPGLTGHELQAYAASGISTDHESSAWEEALEKVRAGINVLIRGGSAARNVTAIAAGLAASGISTEHFAFCTDDKHYADIVAEGHIDHCVRQAIAAGLAPATALTMASHHAARFYRLARRGAIAPGYRADVLVLSSMADVTIDAVYAGGALFDPAMTPLAPSLPDAGLLDTVHIGELDASRLRLAVGVSDHVIELVPDQLLTRHCVERVPQEAGEFVPRNSYDKLVVVERHRSTGNVSVAALKGYGLRGAALATTVAHDSHNILAAGDNDADLLVAIERVRGLGGGYVLAASGAVVAEVPLPIAGLLSTGSGAEVHAQLERLRAAARAHGVPATVDPLITLSFLALPVIPELRLTDRGLFDVVAFAPL